MCCFFMLFYIKQYKNILILIILWGIKMAIKTGVSMISFVITKEMRKKASSNSYKIDCMNYNVN